MRIALIGAGVLPIPPRGWGAVEDTIWHRQRSLEQQGHTVDVFNTRHIHQVIHRINTTPYDFVHCHNEPFTLACHRHLEKPFAVTSHYGGLSALAAERADDPAFTYLLRDTLLAPGNVVLSDQIRALYERLGYEHFLRVLPHAVNVAAFRLAPEGNGRAICLGRVTPRKRQAWLSTALAGRIALDLVGPWDRQVEPNLREHHTIRDLGTWDRRTVYDQLTGYSCLVLLSVSEAAPKVVLEALAAGVSVVISDACAANLTEEPFITVLPAAALDADAVTDAIRRSIAGNAALRPAIRAYAEEHVHQEKAIERYLHLIEEFRAYWSGRCWDHRAHREAQSWGT